MSILLVILFLLIHFVLERSVEIVVREAGK